MKQTTPQLAFYFGDYSAAMRLVRFLARNYVKQRMGSNLQDYAGLSKILREGTEIH